MKLLIDILTFRRMISPFVLQILFWAGVAGSLFGSYVLYTLGNWAWIFPLLLGPLLVRVIFEGALLSFRMYDRLSEIAEHMQKPDIQTDGEI